jgi:lipoic acid synthetase
VTIINTPTDHNKDNTASTNKGSATPRARSGNKFQTPQGFNAIKDGIKAAPAISNETKKSSGKKSSTERKPPWLRISMNTSKKFQTVRATVKEHRLSTVCEESYCPNMNECWSNGTATIMLMGSVCTRACRFCAVDTGNPNGWLDPEEPANAARSVNESSLCGVNVSGSR